MISYSAFALAILSIIIALSDRYIVKAHNDQVYHRTTESSNKNDNSDSFSNIQNHHHHHHHHGLRDLRGLSNDHTENNRKLDGNIPRCATPDLTPDERKQSNRVVQNWIQNNAFRAQQITTININTYFHIITAANQTIGNISNTDVQNQMTVLNDAYRPYGFSFTLLGTTRTENIDWYYASVFSQEEFTMKSKLRVGDSSTLNVYFSNAAGNFGYATLPSFYNSSRVLDGVVVRSGTIPGGDAVPNTEGKTLVHETGHWLGLQHTFVTDLSAYSSLYYLMNIFGFRGDCHFNNDEVLDTPKQSSPTQGCPSRRDSCPMQLGLDPIHNYMDYSDDACYTEFTTGQKNRMLAMWNEYRAI